MLVARLFLSVIFDILGGTGSIQSKPSASHRFPQLEHPFLPSNYRFLLFEGQDLPDLLLCSKLILLELDFLEKSDLGLMLERETAILEAATPQAKNCSQNFTQVMEL